MSLDALSLANRQADTFDRSMWWMKEFPDIRVRALANRLVFNLALIDLEWAAPVIREAARIRAEQIVSEIGWPKKAWLGKRVAAELAHRNAVHAWARAGYGGECPDREVGE